MLVFAMKLNYTFRIYEPNAWAAVIRGSDFNHNTNNRRAKRSRKYGKSRNQYHISRSSCIISTHAFVNFYGYFFLSLSRSYLMQPLFSVSGYSIEFGSVVKLPLPSMLPLIWLGGFDLIACCCNSLWMLLLIIDMYPLWFCELILNEWKRAMLACIDSCKLLALAWHVLDIMAK